MSQPRIGLVVGNGLTLDFLDRHRSMKEQWHPQRPFDWTLATPGQPDAPLLASLPTLATAITRARRANPQVTDFDLFAAFARKFPGLSTDWSDDEIHPVALDVESRHFLAIAYSHLQYVLDRLEGGRWPWGRWLIQHTAFIVGAVSLNYDLLLETVFGSAGRGSTPYGILASPLAMRLLKPHGSIDYAPDPAAIQLPPATYPLRFWNSLNNTPIVPIPDDRLLDPRSEACIIVPGEASPIVDYQWVRPGYEHIRATWHSLTQRIFLGVSYWICDRPELDYILDSLGADTIVMAGNPYPNPDFQAAVEARGLRYEPPWQDVPQVLPV